MNSSIPGIFNRLSIVGSPNSSFVIMSLNDFSNLSSLVRRYISRASSLDERTDSRSVNNLLSVSLFVLGFITYGIILQISFIFLYKYYVLFYNFH